VSRPNLLALDSELASPAEGGAGFMASALKAGPGVVCATGTATPRAVILYADRASQARRRAFAAQLGTYEGLLTWGGLTFDVPVLNAWWPDWSKHLPNRHVDLMALCTLLAHGVPAEQLERLGLGWTKRWPSWKRLVRGWGLDNVGMHTLQRRKVEGMTGAAAPIAWQAGRLDEVTEYCLGDVTLLWRLYWHAWNGGALSNGSASVRIPRELL